MRAFSLLCRHDIGGSLRTTIVFRVAGAGGGEWYVDLAPEAAMSSEGAVDRLGLVIRLRDTSVITTVIFIFIMCWNEFTFALLMTDESTRSLRIGLNSTVGYRGILWDQMAATGMVIMIPHVHSVLRHSQVFRRRCNHGRGQVRFLASMK